MKPRTRNAPDVMKLDAFAPLPTPPLDDVVAARRVWRTGTRRRPVDLRVGRPIEYVESHGSFWACPYQIRGIGDPAVRAAYGSDSLQALEMAFQAIRVDLLASGGLYAIDPEVPASRTGFFLARAIPYSLGPSFERRIERLLDTEMRTFVARARRCAAARSRTRSRNRKPR